MGNGAPKTIVEIPESERVPGRNEAYKYVASGDSEPYGEEKDALEGEPPKENAEPSSVRTHQYVERSKEELEALVKTPTVRFRQGGHEIMAVSEAARAVLRTKDLLLHPRGRQEQPTEAE